MKKIFETFFVTILLLSCNFRGDDFDNNIYVSELNLDTHICYDDTLSYVRFDDFMVDIIIPRSTIEFDKKKVNMDYFSMIHDRDTLRLRYIAGGCREYNEYQDIVFTMLLVGPTMANDSFSLEDLHDNMIEEILRTRFFYRDKQAKLVDSLKITFYYQNKYIVYRRDTSGFSKRIYEEKNLACD